MKNFTKNMTIGEALTISDKCEAVLTGFGMHCFHCPMSQMETIEEACLVHGLDVNLVLTELNKLL